MFLKALAVALLSFMACGAVAAESPALDGKWEGKVNHEGRMKTLAFEFKVQGESLTGMVFLDGVEFGEVEDGKLASNQLSFHCNTTKFNGSLTGQDLHMTVTVFNGNKLNLTAARKK